MQCEVNFYKCYIITVLEGHCTIYDIYTISHAHMKNSYILLLKDLETGKKNYTPECETKILHYINSWRNKKEFALCATTINGF